MSSSTRYESDNVDPSPLGKPLDFPYSKITAPNRFLKAAMTERLSSWDPKDLPARGIPSKELINVYKRWGEGQYGLILTGNTMIEYDQLEAAGNPIIPREANPDGPRFEAFRDLASAAKAHGSLIVCQISHPGRQCAANIQEDPVSASDIQLEGNVMGMTFNKPHAASLDEIERVIDGFAHAATYLEKAGYHGIELHAAHGYLLSQFLADSTNKRTDQYGGSLENRARLIVEIARRVKKQTSEKFMLGIKLNSVEFQSGGFSPDDARTLCGTLEREGFDFVELSGGTYEHLAFGHQENKRESTKKREAFFIDFAEQITPTLSKTRVYVTGGFKTAGAMVSALDSVDGVGLARPACQEPALPRDILAGKVQGAKKLRLDDNDFGLTNVAAGTQIRQLGRDTEPIDLTTEENEKAFKKDMETWGKKMGDDKTGSMYGYVDIESVKAAPYGTASA